MQALIVAAVAVAVGGLLGYWLGKTFAQANSRLLEKSLTGLEAERNLVERRTQELTAELTGVRGDLARLQAESAARAGFESLAGEREKTIGQLTAERDGLRQELKAEFDLVSAQGKQIGELNKELESERNNLAEKLALLESAKQTLAHQFEALAADILERKSKTFSEGSQKELGTLLTPLKTQIEEFRKKVEEAQTDSKTGVTKLEMLIGTLGGLNQQLSEEAKNLTTALRGSSKAQGDWGEFILRDLLEKAGLREGEQYSFQQTFTGLEGEDGERSKAARTDVIVFLPGGRHLVIDSKVSLNAYTDLVNAETEEERRTALREHLKSVRGHVTGLAKAGYDSLPGIESPDFVVMFVPVEPAFLIALQNDSTLWADAYQQKILLVGPTTLLYVIRIVSVLWHQEAQVRNVDEVMDRGAKLYEKFAGFIDDMEELGKSLNGASKSYVEARKKLSEGPGNLVVQVEKLRQLGVKRKPQIGIKPKPQKTIPLKWLASAGEEDAGLELAAEAEEMAEQGESAEAE
ncbi:MAG: DNA recombination protein RmuC [Terracidiphilus sp.]|jgi:DNA recombination protein RmuC